MEIINKMLNIKNRIYKLNNRKNIIIENKIKLMF